MKCWLNLIFLFIFTCSSTCFGEVIIDKPTQRVLIGYGLERYTGKGEPNFADTSASSFQSLESKVPNLGISPADIWFRLPVTNKGKEKLELLLEIAYPLLDEVELFVPSSNGHYNSIKLGEHQSFSARKYKVPNYAFDIQLPGNEKTIFFLRIKSTEQIILPIYLSNERSFLKEMNDDSLLSGIYIGIVGIMAIYNLFLFFSVRERGYLYYVLYVLCAGITQMGIKGYSFQYLWPNWIYFATKGPIIFGCLSGLCALLFADSFLQLPKNAPRSRRVITVFIILFVIGSLLTLLNLTQPAFMVMQLTTGAGSLFVLYLSYRVMINGYKPAKYFVYGWTILLLGSVVFLLKDYGILKYNDFTSNAVQIASVVEMALLSFGLAYSINILKEEKEASQIRELAISLENEKLIREQNIVLEQKVDERTRELTESNESLQTTLTHLKETQSQLVEAEKMASLGQLTAGVAHEINNPINFVTSNVAPLKRDIKMIWETLEEVERIAFKEGISDTEKQSQIKKFKDDQDIEYLKTEVDFLLKGMHDGAHRTAEIVKSLRIFSRVDEDTLKFADLNEGLESTMVILNSLLNNTIEVDKIYGDMPKVECHAGKLNQVFLNIVTNAIYAVNKKFNHDVGGKICIETGVKEDNTAVFIKIADNGIGIPKEIHERIFEPFFTTKDVGEGTGLGMSIAYNTIAKHHGKIIVDSEVGLGTSFTLLIPIQQNN
ncbi:histidine kinase [Sphingobacterium paramultivorum]|uniref:histidine kinase n=1 Tax=Sphingobacterium paramultivorum TaxID=2886510 RepID=A0A7G5E7I6_9SPHI|nr:7TM diverse intracellular signaling domain-containing protein [Sphingobacterium paramultivorum]QMV69961.1 histidine kinase [Sphingobacterium paramultivorum]WSO13790.1 7TM diverse intracellular signaling domain-containing protein [Sphingobacterium paramultivorum]